MLSRFGLLTALLFTTLAAEKAQAEVTGISLADLTNARGIGMGGAFRASGLGAEAVNGNPAALALYKAYNADLSGGWDIGSKTEYLGSLVRDSMTSQLAAGVGYDIISSGHGARRETTNYTSFALALPFGDSFAVGVAGHYLARSNDFDKADAVTMDAGAVVRIGGVFTLGASGHNLVDTRHAEMPRYYALATALVLGAFDLNADLRSALLPGGFKPTVNAGAEYTIAQAVPLRVGYTYDGDDKSNYLSGGAGWMSEGSGVELSYRGQLKGPSKLLVLTIKGQF